MNPSEIFTQKRDDILRIAERHGAQNVRIFGSVARGEAREDSDLDVLVDIKPGRSLFDLGGLLIELQELLGCRVDVVTELGLRPRIRERVLREAVSLRETTANGSSTFRKPSNGSRSMPPVVEIVSNWTN